jgi:glutamate 5-kinase
MKKLRLVFNVEEEILIDSSHRIQKDMLNAIAMILSNFRNSDRHIILVTAGAIASGMEKLQVAEYPQSLAEKQAFAAIGQVELIKRYQNIFDEYTQMVAQVLLARNMVTEKKQRFNATNTFKKLLSLGIIPIINENDTISAEDIVEENNYILTKTVCDIVNADALIIIEKDLSFRLLCKGNTVYYPLETKEKLIQCIDSYNFNPRSRQKAVYPEVFPEHAEIYKL